MKDGEAWCVDVFDPLVFADQSVALGSSVIRSYTPASANQKFSLFHIYCSEDRYVYIYNKNHFRIENYEYFNKTTCERN